MLACSCAYESAVHGLLDSTTWASDAAAALLLLLLLLLQPAQYKQA
jgi:hypothetical protein